MSKKEGKQKMKENHCQKAAGDMAGAGRVQPKDQFRCFICLKVFIDPVTIPCGHNFCKSCISKHWDDKENYQCPMCEEHFYTKPQLKINTLISVLVAQLILEVQHKPDTYSSDQQAVKPGEVPCDLCSETKLKAMKSCLVCLISFCQTHLEPHLTFSGLKRHQLINPVENLEDQICRNHNKNLLELFCKTDHTCICQLCTVLGHKNHEFVLLKDEYEEQKAELKKTDDEIQQMIQERRLKIQERRLKIQEIQRSVELSKNAADTETAEGIKAFTALKEFVQRSLVQLKEEIQEKQRITEKQAENFIRELEQEISELEKRSTEVEQLSGSEDHLYFVQRFPCVKAASSMKTWTEVSIRPLSCKGIVERAVCQLTDQLVEDIKKKKVVKAELKSIQKNEVDVTLDPVEAHPKLILSDDGKQVYYGDGKKNLPDKPRRVPDCCSVLAKQSLSSGQFYFEVQVKEKTRWIIGVVRESIERREKITLKPQNRYWTISLTNGHEYRALADPPVHLSLKSALQKVGVFVDYEEGLVSFYDTNSSDLIHSFTDCCFNNTLFPWLCPGSNDGGKNSAPLIITPVNTEDGMDSLRSPSTF